MKKKAAKFNFGIQIGNFLAFVRSKLSLMRRDIVEFEKHGITEDNLTEVETMASDFEKLSSDEEMLGKQVLATQEQGAQAEKVREAIREITNRALRHFGDTSGKYKQFGNMNLSHLEGGNLGYAGSRVSKVATGFLTELQPTGLTQAMITNLDTQVKAYYNKLHAQDDAIADRDVAAAERAEKANTIYRIVAKYCETGKNIWVSINEAKYNDYVIYDTPSGGPEAPAA